MKRFATVKILTGIFITVVFGLAILSLNSRKTLPAEKKEEVDKVAQGMPRFAVWANSGEDKVTKDELRLARGLDVKNSIWDGRTINLFGAKNEIISFNLILEAPIEDLKDLSVVFNSLSGPNSSVIQSRSATKDDLFNFVGRNIELFFVRYLQIKGVSRLSYEPDYDERHVPQRFRLPYTLPKGKSSGLFKDRSDANKYYPDIAVPLELVNPFSIAKRENQSIWVDIYIPKDVPEGIFSGQVKITGPDIQEISIPVTLKVLLFTLPDVPSAKTMVYYSDEDINDRYFGAKWPKPKDFTIKENKRMEDVWFAHHLLAHRHKISLIDDGVGLDFDRLQAWRDNYTFRWAQVLNGSAFGRERGYDGFGVGVSSGIYSVGTYGSWKNAWDEDNPIDMWQRSDRIVSWFEKLLPGVGYFLYLSDEPKQEDSVKIEKWASTIKQNPGPGSRLKTLVTSGLPQIQDRMPSVDIGFDMRGDKFVWEPVFKQWQKEGKSIWAYNGKRPMTGSFATEDDGVALRVIAWTQFKHKIGRWFYWQSTHYKNTSHVSVETNVFQTAWTFGRKGDKLHLKYGETGPDYNNGDGVLFYPGTEMRFPEDNYGIAGPIASLRLKFWRRGIQDMDYLAMAHKVNPVAVDVLVQEMIPKVLWEVGVTDPKDPTYVHADISWSIDPDKWEQARRTLADIIISGSK
ncbi:MAG TPA: DUF4091 domain-containing protein [Candidatus Omnitrophota bacterium]|nr:DUF4091 domain-containing protein [Candidatus Omnitrophota bacterium]HPD85186.1 DUF4091 domain-containing protein [Candidatus Omnitrophota bacterium]HRZ04313.1 DUF4091 domain-containing protein [Candidatus Omnitrophota bacterium]